MARKISNVTQVQRLLELAARQRGGVRTDQATALGVTDHQLMSLVDRGVLRRRRRGLYVVVGSPADHHQAAMLAVLAAPPGAVASHETAAFLHGLAAAPTLVHVTVARDQRVRLPGVVAHRSPVPAPHRAKIGAIPVTSLHRTVVDLASVTDLDTVSSIVDPLIIEGRVRPDRLLRVVDDIVAAPGRHGTTLLRTALELWSRPITPESPAEARLLRRLLERGHDGFETQYELEVGGRRRRIDVAWPERLCGLEYAGAEAHGPAAWPDDEPRMDALKAAGWRIREVDAIDVSPSKTELWDWLDRHLRRTA